MRRPGHRTACGLLRSLEHPDHDSLADDVAIHRLEEGPPRFPCVGARRHVDFRIEGIHLERVVVHGPAAGAPGPRYTAPLALICRIPFGSCAPSGIPSGSPFSVAGMFQTSQCTWSSVVRLRATSGSRIWTTKLCVAAGAFVQTSCGEMPRSACCTCVWRFGITPPSGNAGVDSTIGGPAGPAACRCGLPSRRRRGLSVDGSGDGENSDRDVKQRPSQHVSSIIQCSRGPTARSRSAPSASLGPQALIQCSRGPTPARSRSAPSRLTRAAGAYSVLAGPHPRSLSFGAFAPHSGRRRLFKCSRGPTPARSRSAPSRLTRAAGAGVNLAQNRRGSYTSRPTLYTYFIRSKVWHDGDTRTA